MPSVFIFLTPPVWTPQCGDYWERVTQAANFIIFLLYRHPYYSLPCSSHGVNYWHFNNALAKSCVSGVLSTLLSFEGKIQDKARKALLQQFKAILEEVFVCQALGLKSSPSDAPHPP